jgi:hypothetical protein
VRISSDTDYLCSFLSDLLVVFVTDMQGKRSNPPQTHAIAHVNKGTYMGSPPKLEPRVLPVIGVLRSQQTKGEVRAQTRGLVDLPIAVLLGAVMFAGGFLGGRLAGRLKEIWLRALFFVGLAVLAIKLVLSGFF